MESPISGHLADIFMNHIENQIFDKNFKPKQYKIQYWYQYIDDAIFLVDEPHTLIDEFHKDINNILPQIQFTI